MARRSTLPWLLVFLLLMGGVGGVLVEKQQVNAAEARAAAARHDVETSRTELAEAAAAQATLAVRVDELQSQLGRVNAKLAARVEAPRAAKAVAAKAVKGKARRKHGKKRHR